MTIRKTYIASAVTAAYASAQDWESFDVHTNGSLKQFHFKEHSQWIDVENTGNGMTLAMNSNVFIHDYPYEKQYWAYKPRVRGGSVEYDVEFKDMGCGCVAGLYAVNLNDEQCSENEKAGTPQCATVDVMQANPFGFNTSAHPCSGGNCEGQSQCFYNMAVEGVEKYGSGAYGPGGSKVNTDKKFHVKVEFLSTVNYQSLWGMRTTLSQDGNEIVLEADCQDYIEALNAKIEGSMGFVASAWDNRYTGTATNAEFEQCTSCEEDAPTCSDASFTITDLKWKEYGSNETPPEKEESEDEEEEDEDDSSWAQY